MRAVSIVAVRVGRSHGPSTRTTSRIGVLILFIGAGGLDDYSSFNCPVQAVTHSLNPFQLDLKATEYETHKQSYLAISVVHPHLFLSVLSEVESALGVLAGSPCVRINCSARPHDYQNCEFGCKNVDTIGYSVYKPPFSLMGINRAVLKVRL